MTDIDHTATLPNSPEAELAVIGALLLDNGALDRCADVVSAADFYDPELRAIYSTMLQLLMANRPADAITVHEAGGHELRRMVEASSSIASSVNIRSYARVVHERALARSMIRIAADMAVEARAEGDVLAKIDKVASRLAVLGEARNDSEPRMLADAVGTYLDHLQAESEGRSRVIPTGLRRLDRLLNGGLREGEVMVLGARPKMGKTAMMLTMQRAMSERFSTLVLSQEMPVNELVARHVSALGSINLADLRRPDQAEQPDELWARVAEGAEKLGPLHMQLDDQRGLTLLDVRRKVMQAKRKAGLDVVFVDFLQLMVGDGDNRNQELDRIANGLKAMAGEFRIAVVLLSQLSREADKRPGPPVMTDLRDSGAIEAAADIIALLYREAAHPLGAKGDEWKRFAQVEVVQRNGAPGTVGLHFNGEYQRFSDWDGAWPTKMGKGRGASSYAGGLS